MTTDADPFDTAVPLGDDPAAAYAIEECGKIVVRYLEAVGEGQYALRILEAFGELARSPRSSA